MNKTVGKFYENRGDDSLTVVTSEDGSVIQIIQRDSIALTYPSINFFADSAPKLIELIQKAAKIKPEKVEYEYAIQTDDLSGEPYVVGRHWGSTAEYWGSREDRQTELDWYRSEFTPSSHRLVKRRKAGPVEKA